MKFPPMSFFARKRRNARSRHRADLNPARSSAFAPRVSNPGGATTMARRSRSCRLGKCGWPQQRSPLQDCGRPPEHQRSAFDMRRASSQPGSLKNTHEVSPQRPNDRAFAGRAANGLTFSHGGTRPKYLFQKGFRPQAQFQDELAADTADASWTACGRGLYAHGGRN